MSGFWLVTAAVFLLDHAAKYAAEATLLLGRRVDVIEGVLQWQLTYNSGMALGMLAGNTLAVVALPVAAVAAGWLMLRRYRMTSFTRLAAALITGGFLGNLVDRIVSGYVVDMIFFPWMPWYICNVADVAICVGVALLAISLLCRPQDWQERKKEKSDAKDDPARGA